MGFSNNNSFYSDIPIGIEPRSMYFAKPIFGNLITEYCNPVCKYFYLFKFKDPGNKTYLEIVIKNYKICQIQSTPLKTFDLSFGYPYPVQRESDLFTEPGLKFTH